jgi:hypothetical protein
MPAPESAPSVVERVAPDPEVAALYGNREKSHEARFEQDGTPVDSPAVAASTSEMPGERAADVGVTEQIIDIEEVLAKTEEALRASRLQEHSAPFLADLSQQSKDDIPSIMYRHHDYSSITAQSSVVLNGRKVRVGERLEGGIRLDEILPDSIVLSYRGQQFRLRALNSWVNL